jgi:hypothetical protein
MLIRLQPLTGGLCRLSYATLADEDDDREVISMNDASDRIASISESEVCWYRITLIFQSTDMVSLSSGLRMLQRPTRRHQLLTVYDPACSTWMRSPETSLGPGRHPFDPRGPVWTHSAQAPPRDRSPYPDLRPSRPACQTLRAKTRSGRSAYLACHRPLRRIRKWKMRKSLTNLGRWHKRPVHIRSEWLAREWVNPRST